MKTSVPKCLKCHSDIFEIRVMRDEALASARCVGCSSSYLLLDSKDYWFDVIQRGYPRITRCSCKNESFHLRIDYSMRDDGDVSYAELHSVCSACGTARRQLRFKVDYSGTEHLVNMPLVPCKDPKVLYDLKNIHLLLTLPEIGHIVDHLAKAGCEFLSNVRSGDAWTPVRQDAAEAMASIEKGKYLFIYAMPKLIEVPKAQIEGTKKENAFWKGSEIVRIGPKSYVCSQQFDDALPSIAFCSDPPNHAGITEIGLSFNIDFSNEFISDEKIVAKSQSFRSVTASLLAMLQSEFVSWRGPLCFDNPDTNVRVFGDRFRRKSPMNGKTRT